MSAGWLVFDMFKQGEATATEGGPFHSFLMMSVFEFATRQDPEQSKLMPQYQRILPPSAQGFMDITIREQQGLSESENSMPL